TTCGNRRDQEGEPQQGRAAAHLRPTGDRAALRSRRRRMLVRANRSRILSGGARILDRGAGSLHATRTAQGLRRRRVSGGRGARVPAERLVISESGIATPADVARLRAHGVHAFLVGETFMRAADPGAALRALFA